MKCLLFVISFNRIAFCREKDQNFYNFAKLILRLPTFSQSNIPFCKQIFHFFDRLGFSPMQSDVSDRLTSAIESGSILPSASPSLSSSSSSSSSSSLPSSSLACSSSFYPFNHPRRPLHPRRKQTLFLCSPQTIRHLKERQMDSCLPKIDFLQDPWIPPYNPKPKLNETSCCLHFRHSCDSGILIFWRAIESFANLVKLL